MKTKNFIFILLVCLSAFPLHATTVKWLTPPDYDTICYYSKDLFKCKKDGKYQLVDLTGKKLLPAWAEADSITDFCNGYALFLDYLDNGHSKKTEDGFLSMRIIGFISEKDRVCKKIEGDYRTSFYSFFSDEMLVVANANGEQGFINTNGELVISCQYWRAFPFQQGWASVIKKKDYLFGLIQKETPKYIDKHNNPMTIYFNDGKIRDASSFNESGKAIVGYDKEGKMAVINTKGVVEARGISFDRNLFRFRDYAYNENKDADDHATPHNDMPDFTRDYFAFRADGLWGYKTVADTLLYPQFTHAGRVANGCAIVSLDGKYGIIAFVGGSFSSSVDKTTISFKTELCYYLDIPENLEIGNLEIEFDNGGGNLSKVEPSNFMPTGKGYYTYKFIPQVEKTDKFCLIKIQVRADGLLLWQDTKRLSVKGTTLKNVKIFFNNPGKANPDDLLTFSVKVTNNTDEPITEIVFDIPGYLKNNVESDNEFMSDTQNNKRIEPGKTGTISVTFKVSKQEEVEIPVKAIGERGKELPVSKPQKIKLIPNDA